MMKTLEADVCVVGSGMTGIAAALAAARHGADVILVEAHTYLGGTPSLGMGWLGWTDDEKRMMIRGIPWEVVERLQKVGGASELVDEPINNSLVAIEPSLYQIVIAEMLHEARVRVLLYAQVVGVLLDETRHVNGVVIQGRSEQLTISSRVVIDASGDGDVCAFAGVPFTYGAGAEGQTQVSSAVVRVRNIAWRKFIDYIHEVGWEARHLLKQRSTELDEWLNLIEHAPAFIVGGFTDLTNRARQSGEWRVTDSRLIGCAVPCFDFFVVVSSRVSLADTTTQEMTRAEIDGLDHAGSIYAFLKKWIPGMENALLAGIGPAIGIRETRRFQGDYVLTKEDVLQGQRFADAIALAGYQVSMHIGSTLHREPTRAYDIPYRALLPSGVENLLVAGRCLSATHQAQASIRVIPICAATGQAAGTAAALALQHATTPRQIDIAELQQTLIADGCELGQSYGLR